MIATKWKDRRSIKTGHERGMWKNSGRTLCNLNKTVDPISAKVLKSYNKLSKHQN
jgi:hypothetical protein